MFSVLSVYQSVILSVCLFTSIDKWVVGLELHVSLYTSLQGAHEKIYCFQRWISRGPLPEALLPDQIIFFHGIFGECWHRIVLVPPLQRHAFLVENPGSTSASKLPFCVSTFTLIGFYLVTKYNTSLTFQFPVDEGGYCYEVTTN